MYRVSSLLGLGILAVALAVGVGTTGETKKDKYKGQMPIGWKNLKNLSGAQILKIKSINAEYRAKIHDLEEKIKDLKVKERTEQVKLLTTDQKEQLSRMAIGEETKDKDKKDK